MATTLNPYLTFTSNAREAMEFYQSVFGGTLNVQTYRDATASQDPSDDDRIMHAHLAGDNGIVLMAADTPHGMGIEAGSNVSLSITGDDDATIRGYFAKLADGGSVTMPLDRVAWGDTFGMCTDRYGVHWLLDIAASQ